MSFIIKDVRIFTGEEVIQSGSILVEDGLVKLVADTIPLPHVPSISARPYTLAGSYRCTCPCAGHCPPAGASIPLRGYHYAGYAQRSGRGGEIEECCTAEDGRGGSEKCLLCGDNGQRVASVGSQEVCPRRGQSAVSPFGRVNVVYAEDGNIQMLASLEQWPKPKSEEDAAQFIEQSIKDGADYIKLMHECGHAMGIDIPHPTASFQIAIVKAAKDRGFKVVAQATSVDDTLTVLKAGVDGLAHTFHDKPIMPEVIAAYKANNAWCNPTLVTVGSLTTEGKDIAEAFARDQRVTGLLDQPGKEVMCGCMNLKAPGSKVEYAYDSVSKLKDAGIDIIW